MTGLLCDLRVALRGLARRPGFAAIAVLALGLGIGANSAIFSVVDAALLRPLPYRDADRLVKLYPVSDDGRHRGISGQAYLEWKRGARTLAGLAAYRNGSLSVQGDAGPVRVEGSIVTRDFFEVLGGRPLLGRFLSAEPAGPEVVLSEAVWRAHAGGRPEVIGQPLRINGESYVVVGVAPASLRFPSTAEVWLAPKFVVPEHPLRPFEDPTGNRDNRYLDAIARLASGVGVAAAQSEMTTLEHRLAPGNPDIAAVRVEALRDALVKDSRGQLLLLFVAVGVILLIACANVAHLLLARALTRQHEIAVRLALGASRAQLLRLFVAESAVLAALGGALGLLIASWGAPALVALGPPTLRGVDLGVDARVLLFTGALAVATALIFGVAPAFSRGTTPEALVERTATGGVRRGRVRAALLAAEVALSLVLLVAAGLLVRSLAALSRVDPGFEGREAIIAEIWLPPQQYPERQQRAQFYAAVLDALVASPDVVAAGGVTRLPLSGGNSSRTIVLPDKREHDADLRIATPGYLEALRVPLLAGRGFTAADGPAQRVAVVNGAFARRLYPDGDVLGKNILVDDGQPFEIVGVVGDLRHAGLDRDVRPEVWIPAAVDPWPFMSFVVRGRGDAGRVAGALRRAIADVDPTLAVSKVATMEQRVVESLEGRRFTAWVLGALAGLALVLALVGIYGVIAFSVAQRTRELGIRAALGARPRALLALVVGQSMRPVVVGLAFGLAGAFAATRLLRGLLYGVGAADPLTFAAVPMLLAATAALASLLAARRAARVDPMTALRAD